MRMTSRRLPLRFDIVLSIEKGLVPSKATKTAGANTDGPRVGQGKDSSRN